MSPRESTRADRRLHRPRHRRGYGQSAPDPTPIGGNIMATIKTPNNRPQMATVRPKSTPIPPREEGRSGETVTVARLPNS
jgi:hypothetical protein